MFIVVDGCRDARLRDMRQNEGDGYVPEIILGSDNKKVVRIFFGGESKNVVYRLCFGA